MTRIRISQGLVGLAVLAAAATAWRVTSGPRSGAPPAALREPGGLVSMAATGDSVIAQAWPAPGRDPGFDGVVAVLQRASFAVTNLEQVLGDSRGDAAWPIGSAQAAADLRRAGFTIVTRANNHAADQGETGLRATSDVLEAAGLLHAGAGVDLNRARAPVFSGAAPRRIAVVAVATSASDQARATRTRNEIQGRPGVSGLRYTAEITADPATYAALARMPQATSADTPSSAGIRLSGRLIKKGPRTFVELVADPRDRDEILDTIAAARAEAQVVIVSVHSHEPGNLSQVPAGFTRDFAHQAIDRGAAVVVGTGPRQLRGIEIYKRRVIFHSLGNFAFDAAAIPHGAADVYDADTNLNELALEAVGLTGPPRLPDYNHAIWWESVVATTTFEGGELKEIRLEPIDLGTDLPLEDRGRPRLATGARGLETLQRLTELSKAYGTTIRIENGVGVIDMAPAKAVQP